MNTTFAARPQEPPDASGDTGAIICPACNMGALLWPYIHACCSHCQTNFENIDGVCVVSAATKDWGYTHWNRIQAVADEALRSDWKQAVTGLPSSTKQWLTWAGRAMPLLAAGITRGGTIVDVGCGPGAMSIGLAAAGYSVLGVDASLPLLRFAAARAKQEGLDGRARFVACDFKQLELPPASVDMVVMNGFLEWVPEYYADDPRAPVAIQQEAVVRVGRWLRPGGVLAIGIENRFGLKYLLGGIDDHTRMRLTSILPRFLGGMVYRMKYKKAFRAHTPSYGDLRRWASAAGLVAETPLSPLPTYREPYACVRCDDIAGMRSVIHTNRDRLAGAPWRHRMLASLAHRALPVLACRPEIGSWLTNYFLALLRKPGGPKTRDTLLPPWNSELPPVLVRNQHIGTWKTREHVYRISIDGNTSEREAEGIRFAKSNLPAAMTYHLPRQVNLSSPGTGCHIAQYEILREGSNVQAQATIEPIMRAMSGIEVPDNVPRTNVLNAILWVCFPQGDTSGEALMMEASRHLPLNRLTHGDVRPENIVSEDSIPILVDWEAWGRGHPWLDWLRYRQLTSKDFTTTSDWPEMVRSLDAIVLNDQWGRELFGVPPRAVRLLAVLYVMTANYYARVKSRRDGNDPVGPLVMNILR